MVKYVCAFELDNECVNKTQYAEACIRKDF